MDYLKFLPFALAVPIIIKYFDIRVFLDNGGEDFIWLLVFTHGFSLVLYSYVMSFKFKEAANS